MRQLRESTLDAPSICEHQLEIVLRHVAGSLVIFTRARRTDRVVCRRK